MFNNELETKFKFILLIALIITLGYDILMSSFLILTDEVSLISIINTLLLIMILSMFFNTIITISTNIILLIFYILRLVYEILDGLCNNFIFNIKKIIKSIL